VTEEHVTEEERPRDDRQGCNVQYAFIAEHAPSTR
jgi:hypothetical protein